MNDAVKVTLNIDLGLQINFTDSQIGKCWTYKYWEMYYSAFQLLGQNAWFAQFKGWKALFHSQKFLLLAAGSIAVDLSDTEHHDGVCDREMVSLPGSREAKPIGKVHSRDILPKVLLRISSSPAGLHLAKTQSVMNFSCICPLTNPARLLSYHFSNSLLIQSSWQLRLVSMRIDHSLLSFLLICISLSGA